jgi:hypothetical protein
VPTTAIPPTLEPSATPEPTLTPTPTEIVHKIIPVSSKPKDKPQKVYDQEAKLKAAQKEAYAGDEFLVGKFERPFDQQMAYIPYIDIKETDLYRNEGGDYYLAYIILENNPAELKDADLGFGIEIDADLDGRGNFIVWTKLPTSTEWSVNGVSVWKDANLDVGGKNPVVSDSSPNGDGYEVNIFDSGVGEDPDLVWSRISPDDPKRIELSIKKTMLGDKTKFMWAAWAKEGDPQFSLYDFNDHFTLADAGSAMKKDKPNYPLNKLFALDNTCRSASGYTPSGGEPGLCPKAIQPTKEQVCSYVKVPCPGVYTTVCFTMKLVCN